MSTDRIARLKAMHLYGMAAAWAEHQAEAPSRPAMPEVMLDKLIEAEQADRQARSLRYQIGAARFPVHRDLARFDWAETPLQKAHVEQLATAAFMAQAHNLILVGGTGTGKSHLATALGVAAVHAGKRVRFFNAVDLVNRLEKEKQPGLRRQPRQATDPGRRRHPRRAGLPAVPRRRRGAAVPPGQPALREDLPDHHHQPQLRRMGAGLRRRQNDHGPAGPPHPPLRHPRNRQRLLPLQAAQKGQSAPLTNPLNWKIFDAAAWKLLDAD